MLIKNPQRAAAALTAIVMLAGCAHQTRQPAPSAAPRAAAPPLPTEPCERDAPAYGETDWKAVVSALGGAKKGATRFASAAGRYGKTAWASTGGKAADLAAGLVVRNRSGVMSDCGFAWPAKGEISRGFRPWQNHKGLDICNDIGEPIHAARAGRVIYADNELSGFGKCIILEHESGYTTFYAHNDENLVRAGDHVQCGQQIATLGQTGRATGPHLHFEIRHNGTALDPHPMLP